MVVPIEDFSEGSSVLEVVDPLTAMVLHSPPPEEQRIIASVEDTPKSPKAAISVNQIDKSGIKRRFSSLVGDKYSSIPGPPRAPSKFEIPKSTKRMKLNLSESSSESDDVVVVSKPESSKSKGGLSKQKISSSSSKHGTRSSARLASFFSASSTPMKTKKQSSKPKASAAKNKKTIPESKTKSSPRVKSVSRPKSLNPSSKSSGSGKIKEFKSSMHAKLWDNILKRNFWCERNIHEGDFAAYESLIAQLIDFDLEKTFRGLKGFVRKVVHEFYCNFDSETQDKDHENFGKVFMRGQMLSFSPASINEYLRCKTLENEEFEPDLCKIASEITGGYLQSWPARKDFPASQLSVKYGILHKVSMRNWQATSHGTGINKTMACVLFKIGNSIPFNFGKFIFNQIARVATSKNDRLALVFPCLIYGMLSQQQPSLKDTDSLIVDKEDIRISYRLKMGLHINDVDNDLEDIPNISESSSSDEIKESLALVDEIIQLMDHQILTYQNKRSAAVKIKNSLLKKAKIKEQENLKKHGGETSCVSPEIPQSVPNNAENSSNSTSASPFHPKTKCW